MLFLAHSAAPSGAELSLMHLTEQFSPDEVHVVFAQEGPLLGAFRQRGVPATYVPWSGGGLGLKRSNRSVIRAGLGVLQLLQYGYHLARDRQLCSARVVIARSVKALVYGAVTARVLRVPLVWSVHDRVSADYFGKGQALLIRCLGRLVPDAYIVNSTTTLATVWTGGKPVLHCPPIMGADLSGDLGPSSEASSWVGRVAMVGRIAPWKGQHVFVEAFSRVFAGTGVHGVVVGGPLFGETDYEQTVKDAAASGPCSGQLTFVGHVDDVADELRAADVLVHASTVPEPFGLVVVEGMASGCAVIATSPGGPAEVITDGRDGLLVPCDDVDALEAALRRLVGDPSLLGGLATAATHEASRYAPARLAEVQQTWLRRLANNEAVPRFSSAVGPRQEGQG